MKRTGMDRIYKINRISECGMRKSECGMKRANLQMTRIGREDFRLEI